MQHLVQQLQGAVQVDLDPARRLLDALPRVVGPPALDKAHPQDAQAPQVIHADASRGRQTWGRGGSVSPVFTLLSLLSLRWARAVPPLTQPGQPSLPMNAPTPHFSQVRLLQRSATLDQC